LVVEGELSDEIELGAGHLDGNGHCLVVLAVQVLESDH
jgi:hypothetical protein